jgi:hypothetical protein
MKKVDDPQQFAEWLRDIAQHIEENSALIKSVSVGDKPSDDPDAAVKVIEVVFNRPRR